MSVVINAENISKEYRLGVINHGTLRKDMQSWFARKLGKLDPHARIGEETEHLDNDERYWALKDVDFKIEEGARVGLIGRNGAGKSTLLKILSRITAPTEGSICIKGRVASLLEVGTGFHPELTGRDNVFLNGAILGMKKRDVVRKFDEIVAFSEIGNFIDTPVKRYSSGMYVRLAFAVAAHLDSEILLADEVLAVGDAAFQRKCLGKMEDVSKSQGRTVIFVSHNIAAVSALCSSGIFLEQGRRLPADSLDDCLKLYLSSGSGSQGLSSWQGKAGDDSLWLFSASLQTDANEKGKRSGFVRGEIATLRFAYEILEERHDYVFCAEIFNVRGIKLCEISALESDNIDYDSIIAVGKHSLRMELDTGILAEGQYLLKLDIAIRNVRRIIEDIPTFEFEVVNRESNDGKFIPRRNNIVSPNWKWSHEFETNQSGGSHV